MSECFAAKRAIRNYRGQLLRGVSMVALLTALSSQASAQSMAQLRAVTGIATTAAVANATSQAGQGANATAGMSAAAQRALAYQNQVNQSISLAMQAQSAARAAAQALNPGVPDGLGLGGLQPVANPVPAARDPTGLNTWEGASAPTQATSGTSVQVTINQTQSRAILSWDTFNIGPNTTLTFNQKQNGVAQPDWVALNRVVGQIDPLTGLRDPNTAPAPSQILGSLKADGTVLVLNQNGILFGGTAQVNVHSLVATSLEIGRALDGVTPLSIADRDSEFLNFGLLGFADQASATELPSAFTFSAQAIDSSNYDPLLEGKIEVDAGANIAADTGGFILLTGPKVTNSGQLTAPQGQVSLQSGREITLQRSEGAVDSINPNVRGFVITALNRDDAAGNYVENDGIIEASEGYVSLASTDSGGVINNGILESTTSVSRNGFIQLSGGDIQLGTGSTISIGPEDSKETIPQDPTSLQDFKPSEVDIGSAQSRIEMQQNAMIYAPSGDVIMGADPGPSTNPDSLAPGTSRIFIDSGATIDVAGLTDVQIAASRNEILIRPVTANDLQDAPDYKNGFLDGAAVYVDPRLSGVRSDGVAWVGSPLIPAESYAEQVGVTVQELMTTGGNVTLGVSSFSPSQTTAPAPDVTIKSGATIDLSGGWVTYQAGMVQTTQLVDAGGEVVDISNADPNDTFIGIYNGFVASQPRWGISQTFENPLFSGTQYEAAYSEGRDAGSLTVKASAAVLDGTIYANAYPGPLQLINAQPGTAHSSVYGDLRNLQAAPSQLPAGGMFFVQALGIDQNGNITGGGDIDIVNQADYQPVSSDLGYGQSISLDSDGNLVIPVRDPASLLPTDRLDTITLSADALSGTGLSEVSFATSGKIDIAQDASVTLNPGGIFNAQAGRAITVDGTISAPSGLISLQTVDVGFGSVFLPDTAQLGSFDIVVNGTLSTRGRWVNDFLVPPDQVLGSAYLNGGSISLYVAPRVALDSDTPTVSDTKKGNAPSQTQDISGSILINSGALLDVSGGGYIAPNGSFNLSAKGGNLSLINETTYFQLTDDVNKTPGGIPGFRVTTIDNAGGTAVVPLNPDAINARVTIADGTILANGFAGGGTFTLTTPEFDFGDGPAATGTLLPMDFFSTAGFANYNITSYKTDLIANAFDNGLGGYNAVLATQTLTVGGGQTLSLMQSMFSPILSSQQTAALQGLQTGGDLYSVLTPSVPTDEWDRKAVNLTLGGLIELDVAQGGQVLGEAGGALTVSKLDNEGTIRIPGGTIAQAEILPAIYDSNTTIAVNDLSQAFSVNPDGTVDEKGPNALGIPDPAHPSKLLSNAQLAADYSLYLLGNLPADEGVYLAPGSVTDLPGESIRNPRAKALGQNNLPTVINGRVIDGGTLETLGTLQTSAPLFKQTIGVSIYKSEDPTGVRTAAQLVAAPDSTIDLSGASDVYDQLGANGSFGPAPVWSDGGTLVLSNGGTITGADIHANGGALNALGGTLVALDPVLSQTDPDTPTQNAFSASMITNAGFDTLVAEGSISSDGDVTLDLGRGFFLTSRPFGGTAGQDLNNTAIRDTFVPTISSGGALEIDAPYISFESDFQSVSTPNIGTPGTNSATFRADQIDISGAVVFDQSVANVELDSTGDVRLIGVEPWQQNLNINAQTVPNSLSGQLAVSGNLTINAGQIYPTTGSHFDITSSAADGTITFGKSDAPTPATPYSAGGNLLVQAANIVQGGVIRVPVGSLTLGANTPLTLTTDTTTNQFALATQSVHLLDGSITSVSANGLVIPYGTTTDQTEWFFAPTGSSELTAPPAAILHMGGTDVAMDSGATVDVSGGGDLYAYEFIPGQGGSHDVLSQFNTDPFTGNNGYQYPDGRQVYAIVPGLSNAPGAAYDPIYSSNYSNLYSASGAGTSVYLSAAPGLTAGWYTLLPAQYAMLPGGMRVVEQTGASPIIPAASGALNDGSLVVSGYYGTAGTNAYQSTIRTFDVQPQDVFLKYSDIALTSADQKFAAIAAINGVVTPRLPIDAGRLVLDPAQTLEIDTVLTTTPGQGGRGAEADISGQIFDIVSTLPNTPPSGGAIVLTADSLTNLNASSLLIGGTRTDNADGTTSLDITAQSITVENDSAHPLTGSEIVLAADGSGAGITIADGATIIDGGTSDDNRSGDYIIDGSVGAMTGQGSLLRVAVGPQRQVTRLNMDADAAPGMLSVGASDLEGASVLLDSSGDLTVDPNATIKADALALGAGKVTFTSDGTGLSGLVVTPTLQALFAQAKQLSIRTPNIIDFSSGAYHFADLQLDAPGLSTLDDGGSVTLQTGVLSLGNSSADAGACGGVSTPVCGTGNLAIDASEIDFGSGTLRTYSFGDNVTLASTGGMFVQGVGTFDAGPAELDLQTPFLGDRALTLAPGQDAVLPSLSLTTTGAVNISNPTNATLPTVAGVPGATLSISGQSVSVTDSELRTTAGMLSINSATSIDVSGKAIIETPGYSKTLGDSADPVTVSAPGGVLKLTALNGDIDLGTGTTLSVGGGTGNAGTLDLSASNGTVAFNGTLDANAPGGGGSFILDTGG
ncbi:MAG TPA: filamentous hemagglutinin N-terminal domain-containing protein, partial [Rhizomicrobium sp.]